MSKTHLFALALLSFSLVLVTPGVSEAKRVRHTHSHKVVHRHVTAEQKPNCRVNDRGAKICFNTGATSSTSNTTHTRVKGDARKDAVRQMVVEAAREQGVPVGVALAVARTESNFTCSARSRAGALGVMQIKHATARGIGYKGSASGLFDCRTGIKWGMIYLRQAIDLANGNVCRAAHYYFSGFGAKRMTKSSRSYCGTVMTHMRKTT